MPRIVARFSCPWPTSCEVVRAGAHFFIRRPKRALLINIARPNLGWITLPLALRPDFSGGSVPNIKCYASWRPSAVLDCRSKARSSRMLQLVVVRL